MEADARCAVADRDHVVAAAEINAEVVNVAVERHDLRRLAADGRTADAGNLNLIVCDLRESDVIREIVANDLERVAGQACRHISGQESPQFQNFRRRDHPWWLAAMDGEASRRS